MPVPFPRADGRYKIFWNNVFQNWNTGFRSLWYGCGMPSWLLLIIVSIWHQTAAAAIPVYPDLSDDPVRRPLAIIGDLQHTLFWEKLIGRESNDRERGKLIAALSLENPGLLVLLGDMVAWGDSSSKWHDFDLLMSPLLATRVPMLLAPGNHDYFGQTEKARRNFEERFAQLRLSHWYARYYNGLGLIWLDSNHGELNTQDWQEQKAWLQETLKNMDHDVSVHAVFVFQHHPPFTNSTVTSDDAAVQADFLPAFLAAHKTLAMITGHTHAYEHFKSGGKDFIVSGGGGGPRVALLEKRKRRHEDLFSGPSPRPLHYLLLSVTADGIKLEAKGLESPQPFDTISFSFPSRP